MICVVVKLAESLQLFHYISFELFTGFQPL